MIIGAGPVGSALAARLSGEGKRVRVLTRSGRSPDVADVDAVAVDASDTQALTAQVDGADVLYNCANPGSYQHWQKQWPPLAASILTAAERTGAVLITVSNLYGYGPVTEPMTRATTLRPTDPKGQIRARMWTDALAAHQAGRARVAEVRASDYVGPTLPISSGLLAMYAQSTLQGKPAWVFADPDQPHTWTAIDDVAATLAAVGTQEEAWGSAWIVPSNPPRTVREALTDLHRHAGRDEPRLRKVPRGVLRAGGIVVPVLREVAGVLYQFDAPFVADGAETSTALGIEPTDWDTLIEACAVAWQDRR